MHKGKSLYVMTLAFALIGACSAHAHHHSADAMEMRQVQFVDRYDADTDGRVSSIEFEQSRRDRFDITDVDTSGTVNEEEYVYEWEDRLDAQLAADRASSVRQTSIRFGALDRDDNDVMTWAEYKVSGDRMFARYDTNEDGKINGDDPARSYGWNRDRGNDAKSGGSAKAGTTTKAMNTEKSSEDAAARHQRLLARANRMLRMPSTHTLEGMMTRYDRNEDGVIKRREFNRARKQDFARTDADGNKSVNEEEYVLEYEDRLDTQIAKTRLESVKQAGRRFHALDTDDNDTMTFAEYQVSGHRMFKRWDTGADGYVSVADVLPEPMQDTEQVADANTDANADTDTSQVAVASDSE
ncbi:MAG: hypothetical protein AAF525_13905 [Pseudomonadota bacterium]